MAEESGRLALKAPEQLLKKLTELSGADVTEVLAELFEYAGIESKAYERETYRFDKAVVAGEYLLIEYSESCCEWSYIANAIVKKGKDIEVYANCNCYSASTYEYYALDNTGKKVIFSLPLENADEIVQEDEEFIDRTTEQSVQWKSMIPEQVKLVSPEFCEVQLEEFLSYCE